MFFIVIGILGLSATIFILIYNRFVVLRNQCSEAWSGIDVQLKRRYDLIPNIVETVKGYAKHEKETLENVINARNKAMMAGSISEKTTAENNLAGALKSVFALAENYPELKANQGFLELQKALYDIENNIQNARRYYNALVRDYNIMCEAFPSSIIAYAFSFSKREFFEINESEKENVKIQF